MRFRSCIISILCLFCVSISSISGVTAQSSPPYLQNTLPQTLQRSNDTSQSPAPTAMMIELAFSADENSRQLDQIRQQQDLIATQMQQLGIAIIFRSQLAYNGIAALLSPAQVEQISAWEGVQSIRPLQAKQANNADQTDLIQQVHQVSAATGNNIRIGIIDSGIDYTHAAFGGLGTESAYQNNDPRIIEPGSFPTEQVIGGIDLAGELYDASSTEREYQIPQPDADPLDCSGHGTQVSSIIASRGVLNDGTSYNGPYGVPVEADRFRVLPGIAPQASLYAIKIFGCQGSSALLIPALDYALDPNGDGDTSDHLDIVVISTGTPFGSNDDPDAIAVNNAVQAGIVVVAAAGNSGNVFYSVNSPASAELAIAVGSSEWNGQSYQLAASSSRGPQRGNQALKPELVAPSTNHVVAANGSGNNTSNLNGSSAATAYVAGIVALLLEQNPTWTPAMIKTSLMNHAQALDEAYPQTLIGAGQVQLPQSNTLLAYNQQAPGAVALNYGAPWVSQTTIFSQTLRIDNLGPFARSVQLSAHENRPLAGIDIQLGATQLDLEPQGSALVPVHIRVNPSLLQHEPDPFTQLQDQNLWRSYLSEYSGLIRIEGTGSNEDQVRLRVIQAAALEDVEIYLDQQLIRIADYLALSIGQHELRVVDRPSQQILYQNTFTLDTPSDYSLVLMGNNQYLTDMLILEQAEPIADAAQIRLLNANIPYNAWDIGPLDVYINGHRVASDLQSKQLTDWLTLPAGSYLVEFYCAGDDRNKFSPVSEVQFTIQAGETALVGTGRSSNTHNYYKSQTAFAAISTEQSQQGPSESISVPFLMLPQVASNSTVQSTQIELSSQATQFEVQTQNPGARNQGLNEQNRGGPQTGFASAYWLTATSPQLPQAPASADIQYVGITSNYLANQQIDSSRIYFGLASFGAWSTPNEVEFRIYIDSDGDSRDDVVLINTNSSAFTESASDTFLNLNYRILPDGSYEANEFSFWGAWQSFASPGSFGIEVPPFNTNSVLFSVSAGYLGLSSQQPTFQYRIETYSRDVENFGQIVDRVPSSGMLQYNLTTAPIAPYNSQEPLIGQRPLFLELQQGTITGSVNPATLTTSGAQLLVLHHNQQNSAELVLITTDPNPIKRSTIYQIHLPLLSR
jgi:hypothetical protein